MNTFQAARERTLPTLARALAVATIALSGLLATQAGTAGAATDYPLPTGDAGLIEATQGPFFGRDGIVSWQGALWFAEERANKIGRIATSGQIDEIAVPAGIGNPEQGPFALSPGPDRLWFLSSGFPLEGRIGQMSPSFTFQAWNLGYNRALSLVAMPDGSAWHNYRDGEGVSRWTADGTESFYDGPTYYDPSAMTLGPDGAIWLGDGSSTIKRITTDGNHQNFHAPGDGSLTSLAAGPDGAVWYTKFNPGSMFTRSYGGVIGRITTGGSPQAFQPQNPDLVPTAIVPGPDGAMWFTTKLGAGIGRITTAGQITEMTLPEGRTADSIAFGPDGALWATDSRLNRISRYTRAELLALAPKVPKPAKRPRLLAKRLKLAGSRIPLRIACPKGGAACRGSLTVRVGRKTIAGGRYRVPSGRARTVRVKLNKKGRRLTARRRAIAVKVRLLPRGAAPVKAKLKLLTRRH